MSPDVSQTRLTSSDQLDRNPHDTRVPLPDDRLQSAKEKNSDVPEQGPAPSTPSSSSSDSPQPRSATSDPSLPVVRPAYPLITTYSLLVFATVWGVLARLGLEWIGGFAEREVFAVVWAQIVGCLVMGFVTARKKEIESIYPPLFTMLGTGFCGSLTTWSTMANDTFVAFANLDQPEGTSRFAGFFSGVAVTLITLAAATCALRVGVHLDKALPALPPRLFPSRLSRRSTSIFNAVCLVLGPTFFLGSLFLLIFGPTRWRSLATFAIVLGPPGTLLRYFLSQTFNSRSPRFPLGTFFANTFAALVFSIVGLSARRAAKDSQLSCDALKGLQDGFCASLSTVSTLVVELRGLGTRDAYRYFGASWLLSLGFFVVVLGSWSWSGHKSGLCWA